MRRAIRLSLAALCLVSASCAPKLVTLPSGTGSPFPDFASAYAQATEACGGVRTMAAVLAISGRTQGQRIRAKIDAGFEAPARVRLELPAPGKPFFTYVATGESATLLLPRDGRVLRDAPPEATLEALAGVSLGPEDLRTIVSGCGFSSAAPTGGRGFAGGWIAIDSPAATTWLQQVEGGWRLVAASKREAPGTPTALTGPLVVRYDDFTGGRPLTIRLRRTQDTVVNGRPGTLIDLAMRLSQVDINQPLGDGVFEVEVPANATPITLDELRRAGPLGR